MLCEKEKFEWIALGLIQDPECFNLKPFIQKAFQKKKK